MRAIFPFDGCVNLGIDSSIQLWSEFSERRIASRGAKQSGLRTGMIWRPPQGNGRNMWVVYCSLLMRIVDIPTRQLYFADRPLIPSLCETLLCVSRTSFSEKGSTRKMLFKYCKRLPALAWSCFMVNLWVLCVVTRGEKDSHPNQRLVKNASATVR